MRAHPILVALLLQATSCGSDDAPRSADAGEWADLSRGYDPDSNERPAEPRRIAIPRKGDRGVGSLEFTTQGAESTFAFRFVSADWRARGGVWRADFGLRGYPVHDTAHYRLTIDGEVVPGSPLRRDENGFELPTGTFCSAGGSVFLKLTNGEDPPTEAWLSYTAARGHVENGRWMIEGRRFSGAGLSVWPGERARRAVPGPGVLRFAIAGESAFADPNRSDSKEPGRIAEVVFRISSVGRVLFERPLRIPADGAYERHALELSLPAAGSMTLEFSVEGEFAYTSFLCPILTPARTAPLSSDKPDIIVFQADTFRADNLAAYGGEHPLAPFLEELASRSLLFDQARSVSTYTLPAHATMFSGLFPYQAGVGRDDRRLSNDFETIAELLSAAGYRTGAITDAVFVSSSRGFAQGFEWFDEIRRGMSSTRERMIDFLDADDGRPMFLFLQSYAVHTPYDVRPETREAWGGVFDLDAQFDDLFEHVHTFPDDRQLLSPNQLADLQSAVAKLEGLYRASVVDFDQDFELLYGEIARRGLLDDGYFLFTSDHGEGFLEHDQLWHAGSVFDEQTRIPLMLSGPGIAAGVNSAPVSLIDFAPSLAHWAGLSSPSSWSGLPFERVPMNRPAYMFECHDRAGATWAKLESGKKVIAYESESRRSELRGAFDLELDPDEQIDVRVTAEWPTALAESMRAEVQSLFEPQLEAQQANIDAEVLDELKALGYVGDS